jgi:DNA repair protein RecN (Recombination protein N)
VQLSAARAPAAHRLSDEITEAMQTLAMAGGRFEVALEPCEPAATGLEVVEFRVSANPGQPLRSLAKVASGGELSRIGLAIQVMASRDAAVPTLVFDEVDVGIGGRVAEIVGKLLARLGRDRQVLCVTHLPQVAACADWQWQIAKREQGGDTVSEVTPLDEAARVEEIARMLGGVKITSTTREHAAEMLGGR